MFANTRQRAEHESILLAMGGPADTDFDTDERGDHVVGVLNGEKFTIHYAADGSRIYSDNTPGFARVVFEWVDNGRVAA